MQDRPLIRHIAIHTENPEELAKFYVDVFGMTMRQSYDDVPGTERATFVTDGYIELALIAINTKIYKLDHFGFSMTPEQKAKAIEKLKKYNCEIKKAPPERPYAEDRTYDPAGNKIDLSTTGLRTDLPSALLKV